MGNEYLEMEEYTVHGEEEVLDAFDEFEHYNTLEPVNVKACSPESAADIGYSELQKQINEKRKGNNSGTFSAYVTKIYFDGKLVFEKKLPTRIQW